MKLPLTTTLFLLLSTAVTSLSIPGSDLAIRHAAVIESAHEAPDLEKRRGGGGRGGSSGSSGGGGRTGSGSTSSSSTSSSSNVGGPSRGGSGTKPSYAGGAYYAGGASSPYRSGAVSPRGISPYYLPAAGLLFFPGLWFAGAHIYPYNSPYYYHNDTSNKNESLPVVCLCEQYQECGCDDNNNKTYYESLFNGTQPVNVTGLVNVADINGTETIAINGTLPNGTTVADPTLSSATSVWMMEASGYWSMVAIVASAVWAL